MNPQPVLRRQVFGRQRRPKALAHRSAVLFPHLPQHLLSKLLVVGAIRASPRVAMLQPRSSFLPIPLPQPLGLPVAHPQQSTGIHDPQLLAAHSSQHFHSSQLPLAHLRSPQSDLLSEVLLRGHFYRGQKGTLSPRDNRALIQYWFPAFFAVTCSLRFLRGSHHQSSMPELRIVIPLAASSASSCATADETSPSPGTTTAHSRFSRNSRVLMLHCCNVVGVFCPICISDQCRASANAVSRSGDGPWT